MPRESKESRLARVHQEALAEFDRIQSAVRDERIQCLDDRRFCSISGAQWEGPWEAQFKGRPKLEVNKVRQSVQRIINEFRNSRMAVMFVPRKANDDKQDKTADMLAGLLRADEHDSCADEAFDNALEEAVTGGIGAWRLRHDYEDEDDEEGPQRIYIEPIYDADSCVFFDANAKRQDKSDAKSCFVLDKVTREAFKEEWGIDPSTWSRDINRVEYDWAPADGVYVAEVYKVEKVNRVEQTWVNLVGDEEEHYKEDLDEEDIADLEARGFSFRDEKREKCRKVRKYIMCGERVLKDCGYIAGKHIPVIMTFGTRWFIDGIERAAGQVRYAKDMQRLHNVQLSKLAEIAALSSQDVPIVSPEQIEGHEWSWRERNLKNLAFLTLNSSTDKDGNEMPPGQPPTLQPPQVPPALAALLQFTETSMQDILGRTQQGEELLSGVSGKAVELVQQRLDMQSAIFITNFAKALKWYGRVWRSMAQDIYVEDNREMRTMDEEGDVDFVTINTMKAREGYGIAPKNVIADADMDVFVDVGPSSSSARQATVRALTGMIALAGPDDPQTKSVLTAMAMMNMDGEGIADVRRFFRKKLLDLGAVEPTEEEAKEMQAAAQAAAQQPPDPQTQLAQSMAAKEQASARKYEADTVRTMADAKKIEVETVKLAQEVARGPQQG